MKYLIISILIFTTISCFAINKRLIDGMGAYEAAVKNLRKIEIKLEVANDDPEYWSKKLDEEKKISKGSFFYSPHSIKLYQDHIDESNKRIRELSAKYAEAKEAVKKFEPIKNEYNRQVEIERKRDEFKATILYISKILGFPLAFFIVCLFFSRLITRRNKRLLKEGKITREMYNRMTQGNKSQLFDGQEGINPATGFPLVGIGISDVGGNIMGSSDQYYRDRYHWD